MQERTPPFQAITPREPTKVARRLALLRQGEETAFSPRQPVDTEAAGVGALQEKVHAWWAFLLGTLLYGSLDTLSRKGSDLVRVDFETRIFIYAMGHGSFGRGLCLPSNATLKNSKGYLVRISP